MNLTTLKNKNIFLGWKPLFGLINESFWKGIFGPFFAFIFPLIFITILGTILGYNQILGGSMAISPMAITTTSMPTLLFEFKRSSLLKRIGSTPIRPISFVFVTIIYYLMIIMISIAWCLLFSLLIFGISYWDTGKVVSDGGKYLPTVVAMTFSQSLANVNWGGFIWGQILLTLIGLCFGMVLVSFAKSTVMIQAIGTTMLIISQFLTAMVLPLGTIRSIEPMWYLGYILSPFKAPTNIILESWNGSVIYPTISIDNIVGMPERINLIDYTTKGNPFDINQVIHFYDMNGQDVTIFQKAEKVVSLVLPFFWIALFLTISVKFFKWTAR